MQVGFIGTGNMGRHMAANLINGGYELIVHDKNKEATDELVAQGAVWEDTPKAVAEASQVTITSLPGPPEVESVTLGENGIFEGAASGHIYIDMSTNSPTTIRKIAAIADTKGILMLDAPVSGGARGARLKTLTIMVGGKQAVFESCEPIFKCMGERIFFAGNSGAGCVAKLVNNMMSVSNLIIAIEAMVLGTKGGVDPQRLFEITDASSGSSFMLRNLFPYMIFKGKFAPGFALSLAAKDLRLATDFSREVGVPTVLSQHAYELMNDAMEKGLGDQDHVAYITLLEKAAGVEVRTKDV